MGKNKDKKKEDDIRLPPYLKNKGKGKSIFTKLKEKYFKPQKKKIPLTFNVGIALILFFCYLSITFVCIPTQPQLLIVLLPTLYILIRYIKLEREKYEEKFTS